MSLEFSSLHTLFGSESPTIDELKKIFDDPTEESFSSRDTYYLISKSNIDNEYFWAYARYGKSLPYSPTVYNTEEQVEENNPRTNIQIETDKQLFALYSIKERIFYVSSAKKKALFEDFFKEKLNKDVTIKAFYKDVDAFIEKLKSVEKVKLVAKSNLFNSEGEILDIFPNPKNLYGLGVPDDFCVEANFNRVHPTRGFIDALKKMAGWKQNLEVDALVCIGRDDNNFETIFNSDSFIRKIAIAAGKDERGMYDPNIVMNALIEKLTGDANENKS